MICEVGEHACPNRKGVYRCILDMDKDCITDTLVSDTSFFFIILRVSFLIPYRTIA